MPSLRSILVLNERDPEHPRAGGAEIHVARIFSRLAEKGHSVRWLSTSFRGAARHTRIDGIEVSRHGPLPIYYAGMPLRVRRIAQKENYDIVVECLNKIPFYSPLYAGTPVLALCHHLFGSVAFDQAAWPIAACVVTAEAGLARAYRHTPFLAISDSTATDLSERGIDSTKISVSSPGIDPVAFDVDPTSTRAQRITYLGRLERYKRIDVMLRAGARLMDRFPELEILIIGKGGDRSRLETITRDLGLEGRTRFTGFIEDAERDALLAGSQACVFPSEKEGFGLTVIEANALGTPVVARDAPGLRDSIRDRETGVLVDADLEGEVADDAYASALARIMEGGEDTIVMRRACLEWSKHFDWGRAADDMQAAIEAAIDDTGAAGALGS